MKYLAAQLIIVGIIFGYGPVFAGDSWPVPLSPSTHSAPTDPGPATDPGPPAPSDPRGANAFVSSPELPANLRRVLMLPLACDSFTGPLADGCQILDPVLRAALIKTGKFEVVAADSETLRNCTGQLSWTGEEALPANFFESLKQYYDCDAILFCHLTTLHSSPPLAIGLRLKLVDVKTEKIIWATDEIYDAGNPNVAKAAQLYEKRQQPHQSLAFHIYSFLAWCINTPTRSALDDQWNILHSPRYFGAFAADQVLTTLPQR